MTSSAVDGVVKLSGENLDLQNKKTELKLILTKLL